VEINPLRRARKRFAPEAAPAMFTLLLDADERRVLEYLQMSGKGEQRNSKRLSEIADRCIPSHKASHDSSAFRVCKGGKRMIQVYHSADM
jgi:hypothetical protein